MGTPIVQLDSVWKVYRMGKVEVPALRGMSLKVGQGEFVAVLGPSGSGKSTAMHMIGCLDVPTRGRVLLDGRDISRMSENQLAANRGRRIGFVFQQFNLVPSLSAMENVMLPMVFQGVPGNKREQRARELLELVGLGDRLKHRPTELSGGQQQRVAIARALSNDPALILADEPTGNLDSKTGSFIISYLSELNRKHRKTLIIVTHDERIAKHADRVEHLQDGVVVKSLRGAG